MSTAIATRDDQLPPERRGRGRPVSTGDYDHERADKILGELADGKPIRKICREMGLSSSTVYKWLRENNDFAKRYADARKDQAHALADEALEIADAAQEDFQVDEDGKATFIPEHVQRSKLRVDTRKWFAAKVEPSVFGDSMALTGKDGQPLNGPPMTAEAAIDGLVALAIQHPIAALPLRALLQRALERIPIPE